MKKISFAISIISVVFMACKKSPIHPPPVIPKGTLTPKGSPIGNAIIKTIGPSGGTIFSVDTGITVIVPAGAVSGNTEFSIQPIANTVPNGIATSYLLLPEGKHFDKPVVIQLKYSEDDIDGTGPENLHLAYQDSTGIWHAKNDTKVDSINKTLTVASDHFSRWAAFADVFLNVDRPSIDVNESTYLRVRKVSENTEETQPLIGERILDTSYSSRIRVENWSVNSGGTIEPYLMATGIYTAPPSVPSPNPVTISALIADITNANHIYKMSLKRKVYVSSSFFEVVMDANTNIYPDAVALATNAGVHIEAKNQSGNGATINPSLSGTGSFIWGKANAGSDVFFSIGSVTFGDKYSECQPTVHDATTIGTITVTKWAAKEGDFIEGEYSGEVVHQSSYRECNPIKKSIHGRFRAKRLN